MQKESRRRIWQRNPKDVYVCVSYWLSFVDIAQLFSCVLAEENAQFGSIFYSGLGVTGFAFIARRHLAGHQRLAPYRNE